MTTVRLRQTVTFIPNPDELLEELTKMLYGRDSSVSVREAELVLQIVKRSVRKAETSRSVSKRTLTSGWSHPEALLTAYQNDMNTDLKEALMTMLNPVLTQTEVEWT